MKLFVWDLHGTLEHGNHRAVIEISNQVLATYGHVERFSHEDGLKLYGSKWFEYFTWLLGDASYERALELQEACFALSESDFQIQCQWMRRTEHAKHVLGDIGSRHDQILISNTRASTLEVFLKVLGLEEFFSAENAFAVDQHSRNAARTKIDVLREFLTKSRTYEQLVVVGDSPSDMRLRAVQGAFTCLYTHPEFDFRDAEADLRIRDLRELKRLI